MISPSAAEQKDLRAIFTQRQTPLDILLLKQQQFKYSRFGLYQLPHYIMHIQGRQFVLKSGGDKRSDEKTLQQDGKNIE